MLKGYMVRERLGTPGLDIAQAKVGERKKNIGTLKINNQVEKFVF